MKVTAIVPSAGLSNRMRQEKLEKPYLLLGDKPILAHALGVLDRASVIDEMILVVAKDKVDRVENEIVKKYNIAKVIRVVVGGQMRSESVYMGLQEVQGDTDFILVHDGVRPFLTEKLIEDSLEAAEEFGGAVVAVPVTSTTKEVDGDFFVDRTVPRDRLWSVQTPQVFRKEIILKAYKRAMQEGASKATDDSLLVEQIGYRVKVVMGSYYNIKITTPEDLVFAEGILTQNENMKIEL